MPHRRWKRAVRETINLVQLLDYARSIETTETQARGMERKLQSRTTTEFVNYFCLIFGCWHQKTTNKIFWWRNFSQANAKYVSGKRALNEYTEVICGIGKRKNHQVKLHIDNKIKPVAQHHSRIPSMYVCKWNQDLRKWKIWILYCRKSGGAYPLGVPYRCSAIIEQSTRNTYMRGHASNKLGISTRTTYPPTVDDIFSELGQAKVFSKLDLNQGYHQLELEPECRYITTFSTHIGLKRYIRLDFGVISAAEIFHEIVRSLIDGVPGSLDISDDIIACSAMQAEHDKCLKIVLERSRQNNLSTSNLQL